MKVTIEHLRQHGPEISGYLVNELGQNVPFKTWDCFEFAKLPETKTYKLAKAALWDQFKRKAIRFYLDYVNNFLTVSAIADHYGLDETIASKLIETGRNENH